MKKKLQLALPLAALLAASLSATAADEPKPGWHGSFAAGISMNSGNSDAKSYNLGFDLKYDPKTKNVLKFGGLYLRSDANGETTADKLTAFARDEYSFTDRFFVYGEVAYLSDAIAQVDYIVSPNAGAGYKFVKTDTVTLEALRRLRRRLREVRGAGLHLERCLPRGRGVLLEDLAHRRLHAEGLGPLEVERHRRRLLPLRRRLRRPRSRRSSS